jgi:hypothetical protein
MKTLRYQLTIRDNGDEDNNIEITLTDLSGKRATRVTVEAPIPAINQLKQTLCEDVEREF